MLAGCDEVCSRFVSGDEQARTSAKANKNVSRVNSELVDHANVLLCAKESAGMGLLPGSKPGRPFARHRRKPCIGHVVLAEPEATSACGVSTTQSAG